MDRQNPLEGMQEWLDRLNREFADASRGLEGGFGGVPGGQGPDVDVVDREEEFVVTVDLPGFAPEDVTARVADRTLSIDAEQTTESTADAERYLRRERQARSLSRRIRFPRPVEPDAVSATMNNGVLTITVPTAAPATEGTSIDIE